MGWVVFGIVAVIVWTIYHKIFDVVYLSSNGCITELVVVAVISAIITGALCAALGIQI